MRLFAGLCLASGLVVAVPQMVRADQIPSGSYYQESGGVVVGEAEDFGSRASTGPVSWKLSTELVASDKFQDPANARGGYIMAAPDGTGVNGTPPPSPNPTISYPINITTPGTYQLYVRWDSSVPTTTDTGTADSLFADIAEIKDGTSGTNAVADWYEFTQVTDRDFGTTPWSGTGGKEQNASTASATPATFNFTSGTYTLRFEPREDGVAVDSWILQLSTLPAPTGTGPAESAIVPEPASLGLLLAADGLLVRRRRRSGRR